ncbi:signal recognition particle, SRP9/SRP14 subunit [Pluteus cervinus]|uniref:Signal recognition particle, SRP9/SRP14 subunit n=1 Tax=Pluteus cervinus TaxID=181527 RepID=A0ACD3APK3_9AGAR|nr:signal recognition particle, SRP9/SRP14 subunit [Pluteus cervinus]
MVYIHSWQAYQDAAEALYESSPNNTRYCVKWKSSEGKLVLKITDDTRCIKFKTYSSIFLNRFEALNLSLMQKMQNRRPEPPVHAPVSLQAQGHAATTSTDMQGDDAGAHPAPSAAPSVTPAATAAAGGVKKKKGKKKK